MQMRRRSLESALDHLDDDQRAAATHLSGDATCLAGPGSGKTRTIVCRVAWLLDQGGVNTENILCLTFSVSAAEEMRKRIHELTGIPEDSLKSTVSTFHSQALRAIKAERNRLPFELDGEGVFLPADVKRLLRQGWPRPFIAPIMEKGEDINEIVQAIGIFRRNLVNPEGTAPEENCQYFRHYRAYDRALRTIGRIDFDSMVYWAVELFRIEAVQVNYHYEHVIVDETHDTSYDQAEFARLLAQKGTLFVVGDPSQSIYGFRGASNDLMFSDMDRPVYLLGRNYRSGERIISAFRPHAERNGVSVKLAEAMRAAGTELGQVTLRPFWSEDAQAIEVASLIHGSVMAGNKPSSHAILSRTRALLAPYADMLRERGIPYKWLGKNFWKAKEIQDALAFFRLALNPNDLIAFHRIICSNVGCTKFLGDAFASTVMQAALDRNVPPLEVKYPPDCNNSRLDRWTNAREILTSLMQDANSMTPAVFLTAVMKRAGFGPGENNTDPDDFRQENIVQLVQRASRFQDIRAFVNHADRMARQQSKADSVVLSTIHGAKGLEWDNVFVIGVSDGILPHHKATDIDEERRILYVALSRAKTNLSVCWHGRESVLLQPLLKEFGDPREEKTA